MPDIVPGAGQQMTAAEYHRSLRLRRWLISIAIVAAVCSFGALVISVSFNWQATHRAQATAQAAATEATIAATDAESAADRAEQAHFQADKAVAAAALYRERLCVFLTHAIEEAPPEVKQDARTLAAANQCPATRRTRRRTLAPAPAPGM